MSSDNLELGVLFSVTILILYILGAHLIEIYKIDFVHESGMAILMGALASLILHLAGIEPFQFKESTFFVFILPPIIFAAGYNLKKTNFVKNFGYITLFGVIGTIISFIVLSSLILYCNDVLHEKGSSMRLLTKEFKHSDILIPTLSEWFECLLLASVLCATDTVAALTIVREKSFPTLNSILFGEGVVNDAVAILLFHAIEGMIVSEKATLKQSPFQSRRQEDQGLQLSAQEVAIMFGNFFGLSIFSIFIGIFFGLLCSYMFKRLTDLDKFPVREIFLLLLFAYASYMVSEMLGFSGVITLFCCGLTMSYYAFQNLSQKSKISSTLAIETIGHAAEAFVFTYLGLGIYGMQQDKFSSSFVIAVLFSCILARALGVFLPYLMVGVCRYFDVRINWRQLLLIWFSGSIRGAIAFALSLQISPSLSPNSSLLVSTTLVVVLVTTLLFGGLMSIFTRFIGLKEETINPSNLQQLNINIFHFYAAIRFIDYSTLIGGNQPSQQVEHQTEKEPIQEIWEHFDYKYMQPIFLKEMIIHKDLLDIKQNPFQSEEDSKGEQLTHDDLVGFDDNIRMGSNLDGRYPVSPASTNKKAKQYSTKEIEMKSIIFN